MFGERHEDDVVVSKSRGFAPNVSPSEGAAWLREQLRFLDSTSVLVNLDGDGSIYSGSATDEHFDEP